MTFTLGHSPGMLYALLYATSVAAVNGPTWVRRAETKT